MATSSSLSIPALIISAGLTLSSFNALYEEDNVSIAFSFSEIAIYQTTSSNPLAEEYVLEYGDEKPRQAALELFGVQSNYTYDERETYRKMLAQDAVDVGVNIFDLFE